MNAPQVTAIDWPLEIHGALKAAGVSLVSYVPDAGHKRLIELCHADASMRSVVLTTEEEGLGFATGAWLGGERSVLLMQSSGVGNCINMLSLTRECRFPLILLVTMRGEWGETNPWQVAMGQSTASALHGAGVILHRVETADEVGPVVASAVELAFQSTRAVAVLLGQRLIGSKRFQ